MEWKKNLNINSFYTSFGILLSGNLFAQGINLIFSFFFAKIFGLTAFGEFGIFLSFILIVAEVLNLKLDQALVLCSNDNEVEITMKYANKIGGFIAILAALFSSFFLIWHVEYWLYLFLVFFTLWFYGKQQMLSAFFLWKKSFKILSISRIIQVLGGGFATILCYVLHLKINGLIVGFMIGNICSYLYLFIIKSKYGIVQNNENSSFSPKIAFGSFLTFGTLSSLLNALGRHLPVFFFRLFYGLDVVGSYSFANRIVQAPLAIVSQSLGRVFFQKAAEQENSNPKLNKSLIYNTLLFSTLSSILPLFLLGIFGASFFVFVFGQQWLEAGKIAMILSPIFFISFVAQPISMFLDVKNKLKWEFMFNFIMVLVRVSILFFMGLNFKFETTLMTYSIVGVLFYVWLIAKVFNIAKH